MSIHTLSLKDGYLHVDMLLEFIGELKFSEVTTYVWYMNPKMQLSHMKDGNGEHILKTDPETKIDFLLNRPVMYDKDISKDVILFKPYS